MVWHYYIMRRTTLEKCGRLCGLNKGYVGYAMIKDVKTAITSFLRRRWETVEHPKHGAHLLYLLNVFGENNSTDEIEELLSEMIMQGLLAKEGSLYFYKDEEDAR